MSDQLLAENVATPVKVSAEEYFEKYAEQFYEWVDGVLVKMGASQEHNKLTAYLANLFDEYLAYMPIGSLQIAPFLMELEAINRKREPDLQIILNTNSGQLTSTRMIGPADICIEVVSPESVQRDYGEKLIEYEKAGVKEYWIFDPLRHDARFYRLGEDGYYRPQSLDEQGNYCTSLLPKFVLHVATLWLDKLPIPSQVGEIVKKMLSDEA